MDDLLPFLGFFWLNIFIKHNLNIKKSEHSQFFFSTVASVNYNFKSVQRVINSTTCRHLTLLYTLLQMCTQPACLMRQFANFTHRIQLYTNDKRCS